MSVVHWVAEMVDHWGVKKVFEMVDTWVGLMVMCLEPFFCTNTTTVT